MIAVVPLGTVKHVVGTLGITVIVPELEERMGTRGGVAGNEYVPVLRFTFVAVPPGVVAGGNAPAPNPYAEP